MIDRCSFITGDRVIGKGQLYDRYDIKAQHTESTNLRKSKTSAYREHLSIMANKTKTIVDDSLVTAFDDGLSGHR